MFFRIPDLGSQTYIVESLMTFFKEKVSIILFIFAQFASSAVKKKLIFKFVIFVATIKVGQLIFLTPLFSCYFWLRDPRSGMDKNQDPGDKHSGSAFLRPCASKTDDYAAM
jgi:hypothetical protein